MVDAFTLLEKNQRYTDTTAFVMFLSTIRLIKHFGGVSQNSRLPMLTIFMAIYDSRSFLLFLMMCHSQKKCGTTETGLRETMGR